MIFKKRIYLFILLSVLGLSLFCGGTAYSYGDNDEILIDDRVTFGETADCSESNDCCQCTFKYKVIYDSPSGMQTYDFLTTAKIKYFTRDQVLWKKQNPYEASQYFYLKFLLNNPDTRLEGYDGRCELVLQFGNAQTGLGEYVEENISESVKERFDDSAGLLGGPPSLEYDFGACIPYHKFCCCNAESGEFKTRYFGCTAVVGSETECVAGSKKALEYDNNNCTSLEESTVGEIKVQTPELGIDIGYLQQRVQELNKLGLGSGSVAVIGLITRMINWITGIIGTFALALYIWAGILWMTAMGNSERTGQAKTLIIWTTVAVVLILFSYILAQFVFYIIGKAA